MFKHLWLIGGLLLLIPNAYGQVDRGSLTGTVRDSSGLVAPGVSVMALENATGLSRTAVTSSSGAYTVPELL